MRYMIGVEEVERAKKIEEVTKVTGAEKATQAIGTTTLRHQDPRIREDDCLLCTLNF